MCCTDRKSNDGVRRQDADMNNDDKEKQDPTEGKSNVTVRRNRETQDEDHRDSKRQRLSSAATRRSKPDAGVLKYWDHVSGGELSEVQKARRLEVEDLNQMRVVDRVPYSFVKHRTGKEPIKVRWVDPLKNQRDKQEEAGGDGVPPLVQNRWLHEVATAQWDQAAWVRTGETREQLRDRDVACRHQHSVLLRSKQRRNIRRTATRDVEQRMS